jgi:hypothetical protein
MTRRRKWLRSEKIAVGVVAAIGIPILLFLWILKESLVGHTTLVKVWSCTACLKDQPTVCGVFESDDISPALDEERARFKAWMKLCDKLVKPDFRYDRSVCNDIDDERTTYTCSSRRAWRQMGGSLGRVH